jgi:hypothetical protein
LIISWHYSGAESIYGATLAIYKQNKAIGIWNVIERKTLSSNLSGQFVDTDITVTGTLSYKAVLSLATGTTISASLDILITSIKQPTLIISYDDGPLSDYYKAYKVHKQYGQFAPAEICVNLRSPIVQQSSYLKELITAGWEIVSHGANHRSLIRIAVTLVSPGDLTELKASTDPSCLGGKPELNILDASGKILETKTVAKYTGNKIVFGASLSASTVGSASFVVASDAQVEDEMGGLNRYLSAQCGVSVVHYTYPFSFYDTASRQACMQYYQTGRVIWPSAYYYNAVNPYGSFDPYMLRSLSMDTKDTSDAQIIAYLDTARSQSCLAILYGHSYSDTMTSDRIDNAIQWAVARGFRILTRSTFFAYLKDLGF